MKSSLSPLRAAILISGGADSTFALLKATRKYRFVEAITFSFMEKSTCCTPSDIEDAAYYSKLFGVKHRIIDVSREFSNEVIKKTENIYLSGKTPNPCAICNKKVKIEQFIKTNCPAKYDVVITGHYARITKYAGRYCIERAVDIKKDQSYFLGRLSEPYLKYLELPCGDFSKTDIRRELEEMGLEIHKKRESQDLCFADSSEYKKFKKQLSLPGNITHIATGKVIGKHKGIINYTVGQRKGLGISWESPLYVVKVDPANNTIFVGEKEFLYTDTIYINNINWLCSDKQPSLDGKVKIRSLSPLFDAHFTETGSDTAKITVNKKIFAVTPGQLAVFYKNNRLILSGWII